MRFRPIPPIAYVKNRRSIIFRFSTGALIPLVFLLKPPILLLFPVEKSELDERPLMSNSFWLDNLFGL